MLEVDEENFKNELSFQFSTTRRRYDAETFDA